MFIGNIISAANWYADVALAALLLLFLLAGIIKGFAKSTKGFFVFVFVVCVSLLLTGLTQDAAVESSLGTSIHDGIASASDDWGLAFNSPVTVNADGAYCITVDGNEVALTGGDFGFKGTVANFVAKQFHVEEGETVAGAAVNSVTSICVAAILFLVFVIGITLVFFVLRHLVAPMAKTTVPGVRAADRVLGGVFSLLIGLVFVWVVFAVIASIGDKAAVAGDYLSASKFAGLFYNNNPVSTLFTQIFGN